jgi:hypothetical protein
MSSYIDARTGKERQMPTDRSVKAELRVGSPTCQCSMCDLFFTGISPFDKHQTEAGGCRTPDQMRAIGMVTNEHGVWQKGVSAKKAEAGVPC